MAEVGGKLNKGVFIISLDTELAWGMGGDDRYLKDFEATRGIIQKILDLFEKYDIKATWAVVGELFKESRGIDDVWNGKDVVEKIRNAQPQQEIGSHSFSHKVVGEDCDLGCFKDSLSKSKEIAENNGFKLLSYVYPKNKIGFTQELPLFGFSSYRGVNPNWYSGFPRVFKKIAHAIDNYFLLTPPTVLPVKDGNVLNIPGSYFFPHARSWAKFLPRGFRSKKSIKGLDRAVKNKEIFHLWFHPFNLASDPDSLLSELENVLVNFSRLREKGSLENLTMSQVAERLW